MPLREQKNYVPHKSRLLISTPTTAQLFNLSASSHPNWQTYCSKMPWGACPFILPLFLSYDEPEEAMVQREDIQSIFLLIFQGSVPIRQWSQKTVPNNYRKPTIRKTVSALKLSPCKTPTIFKSNQKPIVKPPLKPDGISSQLMPCRC